MKTVLYCRVSTVDQTLEHQRVQAEQAGFKPDLVLADHGISGIATWLRDAPTTGTGLAGSPRPSERNENIYEISQGMGGTPGITYRDRLPITLIPVMGVHEANSCAAGHLPDAWTDCPPIRRSPKTTCPKS